MTAAALDPEIIKPLDRPAAERLDKRVRLLVGNIHDSIAKLYNLLQEARCGDVHAALGFSSWTAYVADVFTVQVRLEPAQRRELVGYLSGEGMGQHAIAAALDVGVGTINRDLAVVSPVPNGTAATTTTGLDGKTYQRKPKPKPKFVTDLNNARTALETLGYAITDRDQASQGITLAHSYTMNYPRLTTALKRQQTASLNYCGRFPADSRID